MDFRRRWPTSEMPCTHVVFFECFQPRLATSNESAVSFRSMLIPLFSGVSYAHSPLRTSAKMECSSGTAARARRCVFLQNFPK